MTFGEIRERAAHMRAQNLAAAARQAHAREELRRARGGR